MIVAPAVLVLALLLGACADQSVSTAEVREAAKERVRQKLGLSPSTALFSTVWAGRSRDGELVLCGRVAGAPEGRGSIEPRRFIAALEPARWVLFEPASNPSIPSQPGKFIEWETACAGENDV
jgi:hypothetical protein